MATAFMDSLSMSLKEMGVDPKLFKLTIQPGGVADRDPQILELYYHSVLEPDSYLTEKVIIEIGARSLMEPASDRSIHTIIGVVVPNRPSRALHLQYLLLTPSVHSWKKYFCFMKNFPNPKKKCAMNECPYISTTWKS
jgi:hypothetical protein